MEKQISSPPLILASSSKIRQQILKNAGFDFLVIPANIDESLLKKSCQENSEMAKICAQKLALLKAKSVSEKKPNAWVIGCDQLLSCEGKWFDKPSNIKEAYQDLKFLRGKTHILHTATTIFANNKPIYRHLSEPKMTMRNFSDEFLENYCKSMGQGLLQSVGCYQIENIGIQLFSKIQGDYFAIMGLPIVELSNFLNANKI